MNRQVLVKICGVKTSKLALIAARLGANFIGVVFYKKSKRFVTTLMAKEICYALKKTNTAVVGVFVDHTAQEILDVCTYTGINFVQLHDVIARNEAYKLPQNIKRIYVIDVDYDGTILDSEDKKNIRLLNQKRDFLLFDGIRHGSGKAFDFKQFKYKYDFPFFLSGGLNADNVKNAIRIISPDGVDVSSGVENDLEKKDEYLINQFIKQVKNVGDL